MTAARRMLRQTMLSRKLLKQCLCLWACLSPWNDTVARRPSSTSLITYQGTMICLSRFIAVLRVSYGVGICQLWSCPRTDTLHVAHIAVFRGAMQCAACGGPSWHEGGDGSDARARPHQDSCSYAPGDANTIHGCVGGGELPGVETQCMPLWSHSEWLCLFCILLRLYFIRFWLRKDVAARYSQLQ